MLTINAVPDPFGEPIHYITIGVVFAQTTSADFTKSAKPYNTIHELTIKSDINRFDEMVKRPVIVWLHNEALILGSCSPVPK